MSINKAILLGYVGADPEVKYLDSSNANDNRKVATLRLATSERYKDRNGEVKEITEWHNVTIWGNTADIVEKYVRKGSQLYVEGTIRTREYVNRDNQKKVVTDIRATTIQLIGGKADRQVQENTTTKPSNSPGYTEPETNTVEDDDLPF